jgi:hypothetical protein
MNMAPPHQKNRYAQIILSIAGKREHEKLPLVSHFLNEMFSAIERNFNAKADSLSIDLQTGLADGADMKSAEALLLWKHASSTQTGLTGVIPYPEQDYLQTIQHKERFKELYKKCYRKIILDGRYLPGDEPFPRECRSRAYRQQADYLLQSCDALIAITDESETIKAGSTMETVGLALKKGIPVIFFSLKQLHFFWINGADSLRNLISEENQPLTNSSETLAELLLDQIYGDDLKN